MTTAQPISTTLYRLADVQTANQLARALGVPRTVFELVVANNDPLEIYWKHSIPKRNPHGDKRFRIVWESRLEAVARSHKATARRIDDFARKQNIGYPSPAAHGYVRGGSTKSNALPHCGARAIIRADIQDFFPAITKERIEKALRSMGMRAEPARLLAKFVTIDGALPLGLPESPVISNLVCLGMDAELQALADAHGAKYTRYADDITLSGNSNLPGREDIRHILSGHGFKLSDHKFKKSKRGQSHFVTGLSISEHDYPHVPRKIKRNLRLELHWCKKQGLVAHAAARNEDPRSTYLRLSGMVKYVTFIERRKAIDIRDQWTCIAKEFMGPTSYASIHGQDKGMRYLVGDETEFEVDGVRFLAICLVRITDYEEADKAIELLLGDYLTTPGAKGNLDLLQEVGIHYTDAHFDLRTQTLDLMTDCLTWSAVIHFARLDSPSQYREVYLRLFREAVRQEFLTADDVELKFLMERNDKVKVTALEEVVQREYGEAEVHGSHRPKKLPGLKKVEKSNARVVTLPDFVLAAFRNYARLVPGPADLMLDFERIRDHVRYVHDADSGDYYTRKRPFVAIGSP